MVGLLLDGWTAQDASSCCYCLAAKVGARLRGGMEFSALRPCRTRMEQRDLPSVNRCCMSLVHIQAADLSTSGQHSSRAGIVLNVNGAAPRHKKPRQSGAPSRYRSDR